MTSSAQSRLGSDPRSRKHRYAMLVKRLVAVGARADSSPTMSRGERQEEKRRAHEAQKKAKDIDKANDKKSKDRSKDDKKNDKKSNKSPEKQAKKRK